MGHVTIGRDNVIYPNVVIGGEPQDISYAGSDTQVVIGDGNTIREGVTINRGSEKEDGITRIGDKNFLMACCHVAHDCKLGNHIIMANGSLLGGHVHVDDYASLSGAVAVHHFTTIGSYSFIGGLSRVLHDVPPFMLCEGTPARPRCINIVALEAARVFDARDRLPGRSPSADLPGQGRPRSGPRNPARQRPAGAASEPVAGVRRRPARRPARPQPRGEEGGVNPLRVAVIGAGHLGRIHARIAAGARGDRAGGGGRSGRSGATQRGRRKPNTRAVADYRELDRRDRRGDRRHADRHASRDRHGAA